MKHYRAWIHRSIVEEVILDAPDRETAKNMIDEGYYEVEEISEDYEIMTLRKDI